jgi:DNA polymerase
MNVNENISNLNKLIKSCKKCNLWKTKTNYVIGNGLINSKIVFIGEAPGYNEDKTGKPFVGKAGKILDELLLSIDLKREEVYITNILKCRPPKNRNPMADEINICTKYLDYELKQIKPIIISTLGNFSSRFIFNKYKLNFNKISDIHGKIFPLNSNYGKLYILPQYHPAFAVYNPNNIDILKKDFKNIKNIIIKENK